MRLWRGQHGGATCGGWHLRLYRPRRVRSQEATEAAGVADAPGGGRPTPAGTACCVAGEELLSERPAAQPLCPARPCPRPPVSTVLPAVAAPRELCTTPAPWRGLGLGPGSRLLGDVCSVSEARCRGAAGPRRGCVRGRLLDALECPPGPLSRPGRPGSDWPPLPSRVYRNRIRWRSRTSKPGWRLMSRGLGGQAAGGRASLCAWGSRAFLGPGRTGSRRAGPCAWGPPGLPAQRGPGGWPPAPGSASTRAKRGRARAEPRPGPRPRGRLSPAVTPGLSPVQGGVGRAALWGACSGRWKCGRDPPLGGRGRPSCPSCGGCSFPSRVPLVRAEDTVAGPCWGRARPPGREGGRSCSG